MKAVAVAKPDGAVPGQRIAVGRSKSNDIVLRGSKVSKQHAAFCREGEHWKLVDLGSSNGTAVNGNRLQKDRKIKIKSRDVISFWRYTFEFHEASSFIEFLLKVVLR
jgi:pSer/pThr/pTyr-binding forkhead associated (FHA) protein